MKFKDGFLIGIVMIGIVAALYLVIVRGDYQQEENIGDYKVQLLFKKDGCSVYRFKDGINMVYWTDCSGGMSSHPPKEENIVRSNTTASYE